jgi:hypothetical protein
VKELADQRRFVQEYLVEPPLQVRVRRRLVRTSLMATFPVRERIAAEVDDADAPRPISRVTGYLPILSGRGSLMGVGGVPGPGPDRPNTEDRQEVAGL